MKYTTIRVPVELKDRLTEIANKKKVAVWKIILEALTFYEQTEKKIEKGNSIPRLDKCSWYIYKFARSLGAFLDNPNEENLRYVKERIRELRERIFNGRHELLEILSKLIEEYRSTKSTRTKIEINDVAKVIISDIIVNTIFKQ